MNEFTTGLSRTQAERLALLSEECGEVVQIIGKILRHGLKSCDPTVYDGLTNLDMLEAELGHVWFSMDLLYENQDISMDNVLVELDNKAGRVGKYLHYEHNYLGETIGGLNGD